MAKFPEKPAIEFLKDHQVAYNLIPFLRNQDVVQITPSQGEVEFTACVIDGWNNTAKTPGNEVGRKVAHFVAKRFPEIFLSQRQADWKTRAEKAAQLMDGEVLTCWPAHASCVGTFLFGYQDKNVIVTFGSVVVFVWNGQKWERPKEVGDYSLDPQKYPSDVSRFIGRGELKDNPLYSAKPDVVMVPKERPIFIASDGFEDLFTAEEFNQITQDWDIKNPQAFMSKLLAEIEKRKDRQKDDISILFNI